MKATDDDLRAALRLGSRRSPAGRADCPSADALARAADGAREGAPDEIAEHLAGCADCAFEYRLTSGLKPWAEGAAAALQRPASPRSAAARFLPLAAAACLLACLGLVGWVLDLRQQGGRLQAQLADTRQSLQRAEREAADREPAGAPGLAVTERQALAQPHANVPLVDLFPRDAARGSGAAAPSIEVEGTPFVVLILNVREPEPGATYAVEILDGSGSVIWAADDVRAGSEPLTLAVPSHLLSADRYRIRLHRIRGGRRTLLEAYDLRVRGREGSKRP